MKSIYKLTEDAFELFVQFALKVFGNSITFLLAVVAVIIFLINTPFSKQSLREDIYTIILCITFLGFFIIQKSFNKFSTALNIKINELLSTHDKASNRLVNIENSKESELVKLADHYSKMAEQSKKSGDINRSTSIEHMLNETDDDNSPEKDDDNVTKA